MYKHYPMGRQLPALEKNILKYRAIEMIVLLFHIEELKSFVLNSIRASDNLSSQRRRKGPRLPKSVNKLYEKMWAVLVADKVITKSDSDEIKKIIDYRNDIAHRIHELVYDVSRHKITDDYFRTYRKVKYDYNALKKIKHYRDKIYSGIRGKYVMSLSPTPLLFEAAEKAYDEELKRLHKRIKHQMTIRKKENDKINAELKAIDDGFLKEVSPGHPLNISENGTFTKQGAECCYKLFTHEISPLAVAYLMRISYRASCNRYKAWKSTMTN